MIIFLISQRNHMYQELWSGHEKLRRTDGQTDGQLDNFDGCIKLKCHLLQFLLGALRVNIFRGSNSDILFIFAWLFAGLKRPRD